MPESARWLMGKGKVDKTVAILKKAAQVNGKNLTPEVIKEFRVSLILLFPLMSSLGNNTFIVIYQILYI